MSNEPRSSRGTYLLDTSVILAIRRPDRALQVAAQFNGKSEQDLFLSVIKIGEIERDIRQQETRDLVFAHDLRIWLDRTILLFSDRLQPFDAEDARIWGRRAAEIGHTGVDLMIAASALRHVAGNVSDFAPTGARIENPF